MKINKNHTAELIVLAFSDNLSAKNQIVESRGFKGRLEDFQIWGIKDKGRYKAARGAKNIWNKMLIQSDED